MSNFLLPQFETIIGLEIHAQLSTKTKMFCGCTTESWNLGPNEAVCPICMGFPGVLPFPNQEAIQKGLIAALALNCEIPEYAKFDRKNYFYPDLPFGYQISQYDKPVSKNGYLDFNLSDGTEKRIGITRLHLENDAGKLTHITDGSLCDYNRAGVALAEIVTEPDLRSPSEAKVFAEVLQKILRYVNASEADMFKGQMRFDASISLRPIGEKKLYPRAEIKNLNSFKALESALIYEEKRLLELWGKNNPPQKDTTIGWVDAEGKTKFLREKEGADDYRYFPEPDIPPLITTNQEAENLRTKLPELPRAKVKRFIEEYNITKADAVDLSENQILADYFESIAKKSNDAKKTAAWISTELIGKFNEAGIEFSPKKISEENLADLIKAINKNEISGKIAKDVFAEMWNFNKSPREIIEQKGLKQISNSDILEKVANVVILENPGPVGQFKSGKEAVIGFLVGQLMQKTKGQANPGMANEILKKILK